MEELEQRINSVLWQYRKVDTPIKMNLEARISTALRLPAIAAGNLFRIVQEAIQNAVMHSEAGNIDVLIDLQGNVLTVTVADNGKGFSWPAPSAENHFGMSNMEKRANEMNAKLLVSTNGGQGTTLSVKLKVD